MANEDDEEPLTVTSGGTLQLNKPVTPSGVIPPPAGYTPPRVDPPQSLLGTAWNRITGIPEPRILASTSLQETAASNDRILEAAKEGYEASKPDFFPETGPFSKQSMNEGWAGKYISVPAVEGLRQALGILGGAGRGALQMVKEQLAPLDPLTSQVGKLDPTGTGFGRVSGTGPLSSDVAVIPDAFAGSPGILRNITTPVTEAPRGTFYDRESAVAPKTLTRLANERAAAAAPNSAVTFETGRAGFRNLDERGVAFAPEFVDKNIDGIAGATPKEISRALAEDEKSPVALQQQRLQKFKGQGPMTIEQYQGMMEGLRTEAERAGTTTTDGRELFAMRARLHDRFMGATEGDLSVGDASDIQMFQDANKSYQQAHKMETIEKMIADAKRTDNETTSFRTKVKNFLGSEARTRGWTDEEIKAVDDAAERGLPAAALHSVGGRLVVPAVTGAGGYYLGMQHDPLMAQIFGLAGTGAGVAVSTPFRWAENAMARRRIQNAISVLGKSVPPRPMDLPPPNFMPGVLPWISPDER